MYLSRTKHSLYCPPVYLVLLCSAIVEWDTVGIDIIRLHLHTAKWGLFVLYIEKNNSNNNNKNGKCLVALDCSEIWSSLSIFQDPKNTFRCLFLLFLKWK